MLSVKDLLLDNQLPEACVAMSISQDIASAPRILFANSQYQCEFFSVFLGVKTIISKGIFHISQRIFRILAPENFLSFDCENVCASSFLGNGSRASVLCMIVSVSQCNAQYVEDIDDRPIVVSLYFNLADSDFRIRSLINLDSYGCCLSR